MQSAGATAPAHLPPTSGSLPEVCLSTAELKTGAPSKPGSCFFGDVVVRGMGTLEIVPVPHGLSRSESVLATPAVPWLPAGARKRCRVISFAVTTPQQCDFWAVNRSVQFLDSQVWPHRVNSQPNPPFQGPLPFPARPSEDWNGRRHTGCLSLMRGHHPRFNHRVCSSGPERFA